MIFLDDNLAGPIIKEYMLTHGIKQTYLARELGMSPARLGSRLNGKTRINAADYIRICGILGLDAEQFATKHGLYTKIKK